MPTVPTEQNRVGIADVTDAKLQPGDYSGTGLQALGAGMRQLGDVGAKIAGEVQQRQDSDDAFEVKKAWNAYAEGARSIRAEAIGKFDADPRGMLQRVTQDYGGLRDWIRSGLKNDRQRGQFDQVIAERFDYDLSGAFAESEQALRRGQDQQGLLLEQNAADDAVGNPDDRALFEKHLHTGIESIASRAAARGDDPATIAQSITAYRSGIQRRALQNLIGRDPVAAANRYRTIRDGMTAADRQTAQKELFEPLARALGAQDVDGLLPPSELEGPAPFSPEQRASVAGAIEAQPWTEARKHYAREDLETRGSLEDRQRKQATDAAKDKGLAIAEQLGPDFTSIVQLPPEVRRDLDEDTMQTLGLRAQGNLDGRQVAPNGEASLMMNLIASQDPATFAKEDLRLLQGKVTPEEYDAFVRQQQAAGRYPPGNQSVTQQRIGRMVNQPTSFARSSAGDATFVPVAMTQDGGSFSQDRAVALDRAERTGDNPADILRDLKGLPARPAARPATGKTSTDTSGMSLNLLSEAKDKPAIDALKKMGSPAGTAVIFSHGSPTGQIADASRGEGQPALSAATILRRLGNNYKKGMPIILSSCFAANGDVARKLSELTGGVVYAARAFVTVPNETRGKYDLTVYSLGYGVGDKSGYAKFYKGRELPSKLLGVTYDPDSSRWLWKFSDAPTKPGVRVKFQKKSALTELREGWQ